MPYTHSAPAAPGTQAPPLAPPSLRRPPPATRPKTPRPITGRRASLVPYPDLPDTPHGSGGRVSRAEFKRAVFLRRLAELQAAGPAFSKACDGTHLRLAMFLAGAINAQKEHLRENFSDWMESCGGMTGPGFEPAAGSAA